MSTCVVQEQTQQFEPGTQSPALPEKEQNDAQTNCEFGSDALQG